MYKNPPGNVNQSTQSTSETDCPATESLDRTDCAKSELSLYPVDNRQTQVYTKTGRQETLENVYIFIMKWRSLHHEG